jgi:protein TonB
LAQQARIQGNVEFTVDIGTDGHVKNIRLVRGHPLLVNPAKDAVFQYVYRPTLLNGKPVAVRTTVVVPFRLQ